MSAAARPAFTRSACMDEPDLVDPAATIAKFQAQPAERAVPSGRCRAGALAGSR